MGRKVIFLDRDGVVNKYPGDADYVKSWSEFNFLPGAKSALKKLADAGFVIFIISNQAGVGKGIYSKEALDLITKNMLDELNKGGIRICGVYYCTHRPEDDCSCRKPNTGLIDMALSGLGDKGLIKPSDIYFIGDAIIDVETGRKAGLKTILIFSGKEKSENKNNWRVLPDFTATDLSAAVDEIIL